ncbi:MAG: DUF4157 domain-containing protein [Pseudonocardiaceae bacterium]
MKATARELLEVPDEELTPPVAVQASLVPRSQAGPAVGATTNSVANTLGSYRPIEPAVRRGMEAFFGHNFSSVRIHTDAHAASVANSLHARAALGDVDLITPRKVWRHIEQIGSAHRLKFRDVEMLVVTCKRRCWLTELDLTVSNPSCRGLDSAALKPIID